MSISDVVLRKMKLFYAEALEAQGIPIDVELRTPEQEALAAMIEVFIVDSVQLTVSNLSRGALDA